MLLNGYIKLLHITFGGSVRISGMATAGIVELISHVFFLSVNWITDLVFTTGEHCQIGFVSSCKYPDSDVISGLLPLPGMRFAACQCLFKDSLGGNDLFTIYEFQIRSSEGSEFIISFPNPMLCVLIRIVLMGQF